MLSYASYAYYGLALLKTSQYSLVNDDNEMPCTLPYWPLPKGIFSHIRFFTAICIWLWNNKVNNYVIITNQPLVCANENSLQGASVHCQQVLLGKTYVAMIFKIKMDFSKYVVRTILFVFLKKVLVQELVAKVFLIFNEGGSLLHVVN